MYRLLALALVCLLAGISLAEEVVAVKVLETGAGPAVEDGQEAVIAYKLTLEDGTFIDSADPLKPFRFTLGSNSVIPGMSEGVAGMKVGERRELRVPSSLGYGAAGKGSIPANAPLVFEVELLEIVQQEEEEEIELSDRMRDEEFLSKRHARDIRKPAIFEYLIRDFFTKPWRYSDGHIKMWKDTAKLSVVFVLLLAVYLIGKKKGYFIP